MTKVSDNANATFNFSDFIINRWLKLTQDHGISIVNTPIIPQSCTKPSKSYSVYLFSGVNFLSSNCSSTAISCANVMFPTPCAVCMMWSRETYLGGEAVRKEMESLKVLINPLNAKLFWVNLKIYLPFVTFLDTCIEIAQVVEIIPNGRWVPIHQVGILSMPWLLMVWLHKEPGHQQQWYWLVRLKNSSLSTRSVAMRK